jgi:Fe-S cluster assembly scaffold protein SufB
MGAQRMKEQSVQGILAEYRGKNRAWAEKIVSHKKRYFFTPRDLPVASSSGEWASDFELPTHLRREGIRVLDWPQAFSDQSLGIESILASEQPASSQAEALINASFNAGFVLVVGKETDTSKPLSWSVAPKPGQVVKVVVLVSEGVEGLELCETVSGEGRVAYSSLVVLSDSAKATMLRLVDSQADGFLFSQALLSAGAQWRSSNGYLCAGLLACSTANFLNGEGATATQLDFLFGSKKQGFDLSFSNNHVAAKCFSRCSLKAVMAQSSNCAFDGMIRIYPDAQQSDALLECHGMLLSKTSSANMIPGLEIQADDVKATHSASVYHIEEEALFYLMSRGISESDAKRMLVKGFLESVVLQLPASLQSMALSLYTRQG